MTSRFECLLFDLDDTLVVEEASAERAFLQTCALAEQRYGIPAPALHATLRQTCREIWHTSPARAYCVAVGISSWEGLWAEFHGDLPELQILRAWAPTYRLESWRQALLRHGVDDARLAQELAETFPRLRRTLHVAYEDVIPTLNALVVQYPLGLLTNGAPDLQRFKIRAAGLESYFREIVIAGEVGVGKPDPAIYRLILSRMGARAETTMMIGDHLRRDVAGAQEAGLSAIWLNRQGKPREEDIQPAWEINTLTALRAILLEGEALGVSQGAREG